MPRYRYVTDDTACRDTPLRECRLRQPQNISSAMLAFRVTIYDDDIKLIKAVGKTTASHYETIENTGLTLQDCAVPVIRSNGNWKTMDWLADTGPISGWHSALTVAGYRRVLNKGYLSTVQIANMRKKQANNSKP